MLSDDHIFVRLTRKYCDINQIKKEVSYTTIIINETTTTFASSSDIISHLIKNGKYIQKKEDCFSASRSVVIFEALEGDLNFKYIKAHTGSLECDLCNNSHVNTNKGLEIKYHTRHTFGIIPRVLFVWGDCTKYI